MFYNLLKNLITNNYFTKEDMENKLNVFMLYNQISQEQYTELMAMVAPPITPKATSPSSPSDTTATATTA